MTGVTAIGLHIEGVRDDACAFSLGGHHGS